MVNDTVQAELNAPPGRTGRLSVQEFLDDVFERALSAAEEGVELNADLMAQGREELRAHVIEVVRVAREVAPGTERALPSFPGYTVVSEIGRGGMGTVYLCRQQSLGGRPVAVKVLPRDFASSPRERERFRAEAAVVARLRHENIVGVHEMFEVQSQHGRLHGFVMEWVPGLSLAGLLGELKQAPVSGKTIMSAVCRALGTPPNMLDRESYVVFVARMGAAIARALEAVHRAGLLHRDVKPSNTLIRPDGTAMLTDFGLARDIACDQGMTHNGAFAGTPAYAAPEQLRSRGELLTPATDVYGLGATLYHALALRPPVEGNAVQDVLKQIEGGAVQSLRGRDWSIPRDLETIVMKAMDPDPGRRYVSAALMGEDLERLLRLEPISARPGGWIARGIKRARRNRAVMFVAVATFVTTAVLTAFLSFQVFVAPAWARADVASARSALLNQNQVNGIFDLMFTGDQGTITTLPLPDLFRNGGWHRLTLDSTAAALNAYARAQRWRSMDDGMSLERDIVLLVRDCLDVGSRATVSQRVRRAAPSVVRYLHQWFAAGARPRIIEDDLEGAMPLDLRSLGLLAALLGDIDTALKAWSRLDVEGRSDPFVDAWLGIVLIADDLPAKAYPHLRVAAEAFPNTGFIQVYAAEAAARCGDLTKAARLIQEARRLSRQDELGGLDRVEGLITALQGSAQQVHAVYEALCAKTEYNGVRGRDYLRFLAQQQDWERARIVAMLLAEAEASGLLVRLTAEAVRIADMWWETLTLDERETFVQSVLSENPPGLMGWNWRDLTFLNYYRTACQRLAQRGMLQKHVESTALTAADLSPFLQRASLRDIAAVVSVRHASELGVLRAADPQGWAAKAAAEWIAGRVYPSK